MTVRSRRRSPTRSCYRRYGEFLSGGRESTRSHPGGDRGRRRAIRTDAGPGAGAGGIAGLGTGRLGHAGWRDGLRVSRHVWGAPRSCEGRGYRRGGRSRRGGIRRSHERAAPPEPQRRRVGGIGAAYGTWLNRVRGLWRDRLGGRSISGDLFGR